MRIIESDQISLVTPGQVLTIGNFDGVHAGHQSILRQARETAEKLGAPGIAVMTFWPHPAAILRPDGGPRVMTPLELKARLLQDHGVGEVVVVRDSLKVLNLSPREFVDTFLMAHMRPAGVVEGTNFNFGYGRSGNVETLRMLGTTRGFAVTVVQPLKTVVNGEEVTVSSSLARRLIEGGDVAGAAVLLTRPYRLIGATIAGRGKGRELGFPTANIEHGEQALPAEGVYAARVAVADVPGGLLEPRLEIPAAVSIGRAKTFLSDHPLLIEAHMLDGVVGDLGGKWLAIDFVARVRGQRRFESPVELAGQIGRDCQEVRRLLDAAL